MEDREAPIFSNVNYATHGMSDAAVLKDGANIGYNTVDFSALVAENTAKANATGLANTLNGKGYSARVVQANTASNGVMYRVCATSYDSKAEAAQSRSGAHCLYNIYIMSELCSILSFGAGGSTKMVEPGTNHIERVFNLKYPREYTERPEKSLANQAAFAAFYRSLKGAQ